MNRTGCVKKESGGFSTWVDCEALRPMVGSCAGARRIECSDDSILVPQETVQLKSRVSVVPRDSPVRVDQVGAVKWKGPLGGPRARTRGIKDGNHALTGANVAVGNI